MQRKFVEIPNVNLDVVHWLFQWFYPPQNSIFQSVFKVFLSWDVFFWPLILSKKAQVVLNKSRIDGYVADVVNKTCPVALDQIVQRKFVEIPNVNLHVVHWLFQWFYPPHKNCIVESVYKVSFPEMFFCYIKQPSPFLNIFQHFLNTYHYFSRYIRMILTFLENVQTYFGKCLHFT